MSIKKKLLENSDKIKQIAKSNGIKEISVFGSVVRGEDNKESDVDFLVDLEEDKSLFDLIRFKQELEELLNLRVDVVTKRSIHSEIKDKILMEAERL